VAAVKAHRIQALLLVMYDSVHMICSVLRVTTGTSWTIRTHVRRSERRGRIESTYPRSDGAQQPQQ
jgi:hypothetical protein